MDLWVAHRGAVTIVLRNLFSSESIQTIFTHPLSIVATDAVHQEERGEAIAITGTFRAAALFAAPLVVAGMVVVLPLASAIAVVGVVMTAPAFALRKRLAPNAGTT